MGGAVDGGVEVEAAVGIPVAVDILWARLATTSRSIIAHQVRNAVTDMAVVTIEHYRALVFRDVVLVIHIERIGELRLQSRVTLGDVERVRVIPDGQQLGNLRLTRVASIVEPDVVLVAELIVEVECWCHVGHIADGVHIDAAIVLNEVGVLRLHQHTHVIVVLLLIVAQRQADVVGVVLILRIATEVGVEIGVKGLKGAEPGVPLTIIRGNAREGVLGHAAELVGLAVALVLIIAQLVVGLQVGTLPQRLTIGDAGHIALVVAGRGVIAGREIGRVLTCLIFYAKEVHIVVRRVAVLAVANRALETHGDVAAPGIEAAIELQHTPRILVLTIAQAGALIVVDKG